MAAERSFACLFQFITLFTVVDYRQADSLPTPTSSNSRLRLSSYDDEFYAVSVSLGTPPQKNFVLAINPSIDAVVVVDSQYPGFKDTKRRFNASASSTYASFMPPDDDMPHGLRRGTDLIDFSVTGILRDGALAKVDAPWGPTTDQRGVWEFDQLRSQSFDGLIGLHQQYQSGNNASYPYTLFTRKTCSGGLAPEAGYLTVGNSWDDSECTDFRDVSSADYADFCYGPVVLASEFRMSNWTHNNSAYAFLMIVHNAPDVIMPLSMFNSLNSVLKAENINGTYVLPDCSFDEEFTVRINDLDFSLNRNYLVDRVDSRCVLRMRPFSPETSFKSPEAYCRAMCVEPTCSHLEGLRYDFVALGLPFLHRYCIYFATENNSRRVFIAQQKQAVDRVCDYPAYVTPAYQEPSGPPFPDGVTPAVPGGRSFTSSLAFIVSVTVVVTLVIITLSLGLLFRWLRKRRNRTLSRLFSVSSPSFSTNQRRLDQWQIRSNDLIFFEDREVGAGAFARVFLGELVGQGLKLVMERTSPARPRWSRVGLVAVKQAHVQSESSRQDFYHEVELMKRLGQHPHLTGLVGYVDADVPLIVLEYCAKGNLLQYLRANLETCKDAVNTMDEKLQQRSYVNTNISLKDLISLCWQVADGMVYLSSKGYVHRDLAARNILLTEDLHAKVSDFGLCRLSDNEIYEAQRGGKFPVRWTAPESLSSATFTTGSDVWSFGILLYEVFSAGELPYSELDNGDVLPSIQEGLRLEQPALCPLDM